jgi:two-component system, cell cycle response regulator DivK
MRLRPSPPREAALITEGKMTDQRILSSIRHLASIETSNWVVLVVDDEPDNRAIAQKVLAFSGSKVHVAINGADGLKLLEELFPSFILLDLSMPVMDGWEMFKQVRANPKTQHIPVIALTAHAMAGDRERVLQAGFDGYIAKPFRLSTFMSEILRCFRELTRAQPAILREEHLDRD